MGQNLFYFTFDTLKNSDEHLKLKLYQIFWTLHSRQKIILPKFKIKLTKNPDFLDFSPKGFQKVLMKIDKLENVFLNSTNFWQLVFFTLVPPCSYTLNLKTLTKVSKISFDMKYRNLHLKKKIKKTNFISSKKHLTKNNEFLELNAMLQKF